MRFNFYGFFLLLIGVAISSSLFSLQLKPIAGPAVPQQPTDSTALLSIYQKIRSEMPKREYDSVQVYLNTLKALRPYYNGDSLYACIFTDIGSLLANQTGNDTTAFKLSENCFKTSLTLIGPIWGDTSMQYVFTTLSYSNLVMNRMKNYELAYTLNTQVLNLRRRMYGENHFRTANGYSNVGLTFFNNEKYDEALPWFFKAWNFYDKDSLRGNQAYGDLVRNIGISYGHLQKVDSAKEFFDKYIYYSQKRYGSLSRGCINALCICGWNLWNAGFDELAGEYYLKTLEIREKLYGKKSREVVENLLALEASNERVRMNYFSDLCRTTAEKYTWKELDSLYDITKSKNDHLGKLFYALQLKDAALVEFGENDSLFGVSMVRLANVYGSFLAIYPPMAKYCEDMGMPIPDNWYIPYGDIIR